MLSGPIVIGFPVGPIETNCWIVGAPGSKLAAVVDPGGEADRIIAELKKAGLTVTAIVNTHAHFDHAGANRVLRDKTGAPLMIHRLDAPALSQLNLQAMLFGMSSDDSPPADRLIEDGDTIDLKDFTLTVIHTPGHSPGGISISGPGILISGDTLFAGSVGRTDLPGGSWDTLVKSLRTKVMTLPDATKVYPGHGPSTTIGEERAHNPFLR
jgi:hydroxyacylglutathione hydrolase